MPLFGSQPQIGAPFYIGSAEVFSKRLTSLDLHLEWKSPPAGSLRSLSRVLRHRRPAFCQINFHTFFQADVDLLYDRSFRPLLVEPDPVRAGHDRSADDLGRPPARSTRRSRAASIVEQPDLEQPDAFDAGSKYGFVRLVLDRAHPERSRARMPRRCHSRRSVTARFRDGMRTKPLHSAKRTRPPKPVLPNEPYTPVLNALSLDYTRGGGARPGRPSRRRNVPDGRPVRRHTARAIARPPAWCRRSTATRRCSSASTSMQPPANLSMFFQIDVGTASSAEVLKPGDTEWSYLAAGDSWQPLISSAVLIDSTEGFQKPGLITIAVPRDASLEHHSLPSGLVWLRALIRRPPESAARTLAVRTHAALARFQPGTPAARGLRAAPACRDCPPARSRGSCSRNANISRVEQPNPSFGGRGDGRRHRILPAQQRAPAPSQPRGDGMGSRAARARGVSGSLQGQVSAAHRRDRSRPRPATPLWSSCRTCAAPARPTCWSRAPARC